MTRLLKVSVFATMLVTPYVAFANAGVPMLALAWPAQWLALIPIVLLECAVSSQSIQVPFRQLIWPVGKANLVSTLVGIPLAWAEPNARVRRDANLFGICSAAANGRLGGR
jgi:hypothetical protein